MSIGVYVESIDILNCYIRNGIWGMHKILPVLFTVLIASGCDFEFPGADEKFGRQNFVSAVSIIELHNVRNGEYPSSLDNLEFLGDWDAIWLSSVRYEKVDSGYNLFVERGWAGKPTLTFPVDFKKGLGIQDTNVTWVGGEHNNKQQPIADAPAE